LNLWSNARTLNVMNALAPIALVQSTDLMRRSVRSAGPGGAGADGAAASPVAPERPGGVATLLRRSRRSGARQSGSDQCSIVAAPRKPARA
jgi:hypothetical protein